MKRLLVLILLLLCICAKGENLNADDAYRAILHQQGFPEPYIQSLTELHKLHPKWIFIPLLITKLEPQYTWSYVVRQETIVPERSLISGSKSFSKYWHPTDRRNYDAGFRRASQKAVEHFMNPLNFLNECDIFQFEDLASAGNCTAMDVRHLLQGLEWCDKKLENGIPAYKYILLVGKELNVSPLHLASRLRMEQGNGTPLVSGKCGTRLAKYYQEQIKSENGVLVNPARPGKIKVNLKSYDGLYNFFNIEASGNGRFSIYLNGMKEAQKGTPSMARSWGGSPSWNTRWKAIYGGAFKLADHYITNYQSTRYLQKWNVDPRCKAQNGKSRNFWGQYMQNIGAAQSEAAQTFRTLKYQNQLDLPYVFLIPVYYN